MPKMTIEEIAKATGLSVDDLYAMISLKKAIEPDPYTGQMNVLSDNEKTRIRAFLEDAIGNLELNKKLSELENHDLSDLGIGFAVTGFLKNFTYKTRNWFDISTEMPEINRNFDLGIVQGQQLDEEQKITLSQFGALTDLSSSVPILELFESTGLFEDSVSLSALYGDAQDAKKIVKPLEASFAKQFNLSSGAVILEDKAAKMEMANKTMSYTDMVLRTQGSHAAIGYVSKTGKSMMAHTSALYRKDEFNLQELLYSDVYQIKLDALIKPEMQEYLQQHLGINWLQELENKFGDIQRELHDATISTPIGQRMMRHDAYMGDLYGKWSYGVLGASPLAVQHLNLLIRDHTNAQIADMMFAREEFSAQDKSKIRIICSEFVGMCLIASVHELNARVVNELKAKGIGDVPETLIESPVSEYEKLGSLSPARLMTVLDQRGALERIPAPEAVANILKLQSIKEELGHERHAQDDNTLDEFPNPSPQHD